MCWIKIHASITDWEWFDDAKMVKAWLYLLAKANWEDKSWRGITVARGSLVTSRSNLAADLRMSEREIRTILSRLEKTNEIYTNKTNKYSIITICKYDSYQAVGMESDQQKTNKATDQPSPKRPQPKNNRLEKKEIDTKVSIKKESCDLSFVSEEMRPAVQRWLDYKRSRGETYKSGQSLRAMVTKLEKLSDGSARKAEEIVTESMANNYAGLFPLKTMTTTTKTPEYTNRKRWNH